MSKNHNAKNCIQRLRCRTCKENHPNGQRLFSQFISFNSRPQSRDIFQNIFTFFTLLRKFPNFLPVFAGFFTFSALSIPFLKEIASMSLLSRIGSAGKNDYYVRKCKARKDRSLTKRHSNESQDLRNVHQLMKN